MSASSDAIRSPTRSTETDRTCSACALESRTSPVAATSATSTRCCRGTTICARVVPLSGTNFPLIGASQRASCSPDQLARSRASRSPASIWACTHMPARVRGRAAIWARNPVTAPDYAWSSELDRTPRLPGGPGSPGTNWRRACPSTPPAPPAPCHQRRHDQEGAA